MRTLGAACPVDLDPRALAAYRAGIRTLLFPAANAKDLGDVPADVRERMELVPVATMDEVFDLALHRLIIPQRVGDSFVIEVEQEDEEAGPGAGELPQSARRR
jgi:ATP-dependent Lon protease